MTAVTVAALYIMLLVPLNYAVIHCTYLKCQLLESQFADNFVMHINSVVSKPKIYMLDKIPVSPVC
jgi:hypothetical protein